MRAKGAAHGEYDFVFTRLSYESGDWDVDERMPSNLLNSLIEYTTLRVDPTERVIALADPAMLRSPFCYLAGDAGCGRAACLWHSGQAAGTTLISR